MAYNEQLADRIRERLSNLEDVEEKKMMGGLAFMYNDKMCVGVIKDELMCRIDPDKQNELVELQGCRIMDFTGKPMKGFVLIDETGIKSNKDFNFWIDVSLAYNPFAKSSKKNK
jgi:TfoX/Sxy family transcriptional regulator of competence genes